MEPLCSLQNESPSDDSNSNNILRQISSAAPMYTHKHVADNTCRSDYSLQLYKQWDTKLDNIININEALGEYYKNYEHDEVPVKDSVLDGLKHETLPNFEVSTDGSKTLLPDLQNVTNVSLLTLDSHVEFFKITVQNILDNFHNSMQDFEFYKKKFHEILSKTNEEAIVDMEDFIKDLIQHIISSENAIINDMKQPDEKFQNRDMKVEEINTDSRENCVNLQNKASISCTTLTLANTGSCHSSVGTDEGSATIVQAIQNDQGSITQSSSSVTANTNENNSAANTTLDNKCPFNKEVCNIYVVGNPYVQIKIHDRNPMSEISIQKKGSTGRDSKLVLSADNLRPHQSKNIESEEHFDKTITFSDADSEKEIPVKVSYAKRNIPFEEEPFTLEEVGAPSLISKLCDYLCKKLRKF